MADASRIPYYAGAPPRALMDVVNRHLAAGTSALGERLFVIGDVSRHLEAQTESTLALDSRGVAVLVVPLASITPASAARLAGLLQRIGRRSQEDLQEVWAGTKTPALLPAELERFFGEEFSGAGRINHEQQAIVLVDSEPAARSWTILEEELGPQLRDVYLVRGDAVREVHPPHGARPGDAPPEPPSIPPAPPAGEAAERVSEPATWSNRTALAAGALLLGIAFVVVGVLTALRDDGAGLRPGIVQSPVRTVVSGVAPDATHTQWIGQRRVLRTAKDRLLVLYAQPDGLRIVGDEKNQGRTWQGAVTVPQIAASSFAVALDDVGRLHIAFSNGANVSYAPLTKVGDVWQPGEVLQIDSATDSPVVDVAWDESAGLAHVVWAASSGDTESPRWAAIATDGTTSAIADSEELSAPGTATSVLANIAVDGHSRVLATYRSATSTTGWTSRTASRGDDGYVWEPEERLPVEGSMGAATLAMHDRGEAHLVLRDDSTFDLLYLRKDPGTEWTSPEMVASADKTEQIDFPSISLDTASKLMYLFFVDSDVEPPTVALAIRDPATGWEGPDIIGGPEEFPEGAAYPSSVASAPGSPLVVWTTGGDPASIAAARVSAP